MWNMQRKPSPGLPTKVQQRVGGAAPATFVVQPCERHVVALSRQLAFSVHHLFGHDEKRDAFHTGHQLAVRVGDLGKHQMNDVLTQLVLT
jgi:hypothetical protein